MTNGTQPSGERRGREGRKEGPTSASSASSAFVGLAIMIVSQTATLLRVEPFWSWNTPIAWTGFILFADSIVYNARGNSWIRSAPREFAFVALISIPLWLVFEWFNFFLNNWHYTGLPENFWVRQFGYAWSFATISPALFEGAELVGVLRAGRAGQAGRAGRAGTAGEAGWEAGGAGHPALPAHPASPTPPALAAPPALWLALLGAAMLVSPFVVSAETARYMAAPVWLGFIFLLDPINARLGGESVFTDWRAGRFERTINLACSGLLCGVLWEFWNHWAHAKWHYTVPIMENLKIFEMPVPGYLGFPPFALECFTMYEFVRLVLRGGGRAIGI
jgi:hypothetical protein